jgi:phage repressor protein C with HTH and peptisase S24 domain
MSDLNNQQKVEYIINMSEKLGITSNQYGDYTSISNMTAYNVLTKKSKNPRVNNLNIMLKYLENKVRGTSLDKENEASEPKAEYKPAKTNDKVVPYYNVEISGSFLSSFEDAEKHIEFYIDYKPLNDCTAYLPYFGNSMAPMYISGNTLAVKQILNFDVILWGEAHLIITNENANNYKTVKCIHQHTDYSKVILRAVNPKYAGDIVIDKKDILSLYIVKGKIELNEL